MEKIPQLSEEGEEMFESKYTCSKEGNCIIVDKGNVRFIYDVLSNGNLKYRGKDPLQRTRVSITPAEYRKVRIEAERYNRYLKNQSKPLSSQEVSVPPSPKSPDPEQFEMKFK